MDKTLLRERGIYGAAFLVLAINRFLVRMPEVLISQDALDRDDSWYYTIGPWFSALAIVFAAYATYRFFRYRGKAQWVSIVNGIAAPLFWPLIMVPQMVYIVPTWKRRGTNEQRGT